MDAAADADRLAPKSVEDDLGWALTAVLRAYKQAADQTLEGLPGGPRGYRLLAAAAGNCSGSQLVLGQQTGLDRTVVTYLIDGLAAAGLVERRPDPADRRARRVVATEAGVRRLADLQARLSMVDDHILAPLDDDERQRFTLLLGRIAGRLGTARADACDVAGTLSDSCSAEGPPPPSCHDT